MNRLYSVESDLSITGGVADHRLRLSSSSIEAFSALFLRKLLDLSGSTNTSLINHLTYLSKGMEKHSKWASECAKDLFDNSSSSAVVAGSHSPDNVHLITYKINQILGNQTNCLKYLNAENRFGNLYELSDSSKIMK